MLRLHFFELGSFVLFLNVNHFLLLGTFATNTAIQGLFKWLLHWSLWLSTYCLCLIYDISKRHENRRKQSFGSVGKCLIHIFLGVITVLWILYICSSILLLPQFIKQWALISVIMSINNLCLSVLGLKPLHFVFLSYVSHVNHPWFISNMFFSSK